MSRSSARDEVETSADFGRLSRMGTMGTMVSRDEVETSADFGRMSRSGDFSMMDRIGPKKSNQEILADIMTRIDRGEEVEIPDELLEAVQRDSMSRDHVTSYGFGDEDETVYDDEY